MARKFWQRLAWSLGLLFLAPGLAYSALLLSRPARVPVVRNLFEGIEYHRLVRHAPQPLLAHIVEVDLRAPGIAVAVTAPDPSSKQFVAQTTSAFLQASGVQLAINGSFFYPFRSETPWSYYPHAGEPINVIGQSIAHGIPVAAPRPGWGVFCVDGSGRAAIAMTVCPPATQQALAGQSILLRGGRRTDANGWPSRHKTNPRTAVAIDARGETLWAIVVDGRQPGYSAGATLDDLAEIARDLGAAAALNLDGGGSTTLVVAEGSRPKVLNSPIHTRIPRRERPVANHLGIYARARPDGGRS